MMPLKELTLYDKDGVAVAIDPNVDTFLEARASLQAGRDLGAVTAIWATPEPTCGRPECNTLMKLADKGVLFRCLPGETLLQLEAGVADVCFPCSRAAQAELEATGRPVFPLKGGKSYPEEEAPA